MQILGSAADQIPRSQLIVTIQRESKQLRALESENRELRSTLEDYQYALELIMSKYRQQVTHLITSKNGTALTMLNNSLVSASEAKADKELINSQMAKILDMAAVMKEVCWLWLDFVGLD